MHEPCDSVFRRAQHWRHPQQGAVQWQGQARLRRRSPALFFRADQIVPMDYLLILILDVSRGGGAHSRVNNRLFLWDQRSLLQSTGLCGMFDGSMARSATAAQPTPQESFCYKSSCITAAETGHAL